MARKIMIAEDDPFVMDIYNTKLGASGFEVISAVNGLEAVKKLRDEGVRPDMILLDIMMPYMDGLQVLHEIKSIDGVKDIPVILLTNLSQKEQIDEAMGLGAVDYLIKSHFTPSEVLEKINEHLKPEEK